MSDQQRFAKIEKRIHEIEQLLNAPWKQNTTGVGPQGASDEQSNPTLRQSTSVRQVPSAPSNTSKPQHPWYKTLNGWKVLLEIVALPFAILYAIVTWNQWRDLRRNFTLDERSWIEFKPKNDNASLSTFDSAYIPVDMVNIGKTPARKVEILSNAEVLDRQSAPSFNYNNGLQATTYLGALFPNMPLDVHAGTFMPLSPEQRRDLESGKAYIVGYAIVTWEDIFGTPHWMHFCARHAFTAGTSNARVCADYNDTDAH